MQTFLFFAVFVAVFVSALAQVMGGNESTTAPGNNETSPINATVEVECDNKWHRFLDKCYMFKNTEEGYSYDEAKKRCEEDFEAELVTIESKEKQAFVVVKLADHPIGNISWLGSKWVAHKPQHHDLNTTGHGGEHGHHDATDPEAGHFLWDYGANLNNYSNWKDAPKGNMTNQCLTLDTIHGKWSPEKCDSKISGLFCERDLVRKPKGSSTLLWVLVYILLALVIFVLALGCFMFYFRRHSFDSSPKRGSSSRFRGIYYKRSASAKRSNPEF